MASDSGKGVLLKSSTIAEAFREEIVAALKQRSRPPKLVGILSTSAKPSRFYADFTKKQCDELGIEFVLKTTGAAESADMAEGEGVEEAIIQANEDESVDGIMVYYPIFGSQQDHYLQQIVSPLRDVEGLNVRFHYNLYHNIRFLKPATLMSSTLPNAEDVSSSDDKAPPGFVKSILPCTSLAVVKVLENVGVYNKVLPYGDRAFGKTVTVINRSEVVGRPLAALLANDGARVFSADISDIQEYNKRPRASDDSNARKYYTRHTVSACSIPLRDVLGLSDVVISAVPSADYKIKTEFLKEGAICINVSAEKNFEKNVRDKASIYLPSVGPVTITMLLRNLLRLQQYKEA